jgi:hypothetical protein
LAIEAYELADNLMLVGGGALHMLWQRSASSTPVAEHVQVMS